MTRLFSGSTYPFVAKRRKAYAISGALLLLGVAAVLINLFTVGAWQRLGVDLTGGALVRLRVEATMSEEDVRAATRSLGAAQVSALSESGELLERLPLADGETVDGLRARIEEALGGGAQVVSVEAVGPLAEAGLIGKALFAALLALIAALAYLAVRFEPRAGLAALIATLHDVLITLGLIALLRVEVGLPVLAAVLAVLVFSLKDKAVVLDRVRESLAKKGGRKSGPAQLVERAINDTLPRSALTALAALLPLAALAIVGPASARGFALSLIVGTAVASYSSLFLLGPLLIELGSGDTPERKKKTRPQTAPV